MKIIELFQFPRLYNKACYYCTKDPYNRNLSSYDDLQLITAFDFSQTKEGRAFWLALCFYDLEEARTINPYLLNLEI
jgi:hypothetical protein